MDYVCPLSLRPWFCDLSLRKFDLKINTAGWSKITWASIPSPHTKTIIGLGWLEQQFRKAPLLTKIAVVAACHASLSIFTSSSRFRTFLKAFFKPNSRNRSYALITRHLN
jgi:hypothetical protein